MTKLTQILENSKLNLAVINDNLIHPVLQTTNYKPREVFDELKEISNIFFTTGRTARMVGLAGLRGTGKTTLLWQTAKYIYTQYTENIYLFHIGYLKKYDIGIREIHEIIEKELANGRLSSYREKIVLLFDEVHEDTDWASDLKILYDLFPSAFVFATGSSALLLQSTADLVTRMLIMHVFPLNLTEFLEINNTEIQINFEYKAQLKEILFHSNDAKELFKNLQEIQVFADDYFAKIENLSEQIVDYIAYKNITRFSLLQIKTQINQFIADLVRRVIYEDIPKLSAKNTTHFSEKILQRIAASDELNIQTLSQSIGISQKEINQNLDILVKAELLTVLYPFGGIDTKINKAQKYFFMSPSIRRVILSPLVSPKNEKGLFAKLLEDIVVLYLNRIFKSSNIVSFSSMKGQKNPDLIIETIDKPIVIEIGINKNTTKQIRESKIKYKYGIVINSKIDTIEIHNDIVIIPLKYFLLL